MSRSHTLGCASPSGWDGTGKIVDGAVQNQDLGADSVTTDKIDDGAVRSADVLNSSLTSFDVASNSLISDDILNGTLESGDIGTGQVRTPDVLDNNLTGTDVQDQSLGAADLGPSSVTTSEAANDSLTGEDVVESSLGKVPTADTLDGLDSGDFNQGGGRTARYDEAVFPGSTSIGSPLIPGYLDVHYHCPNDLSNNRTVGFHDKSGEGAFLFVDNGLANPTFTQLDREEPAFAGGELLTAHVLWGDFRRSQAVVWVSSIHQGFCHFQVQALFTTN